MSFLTKKIKIIYQESDWKNGFDPDDIEFDDETDETATYEIFRQNLIYEDIEEEFPANVDIIDLHQLGISKIDTHQFAKFPKLKEIVLGYNRLGFPDPFDLSGLSKCKKLEVIILERNSHRWINLTPLGSCPNFKGITLRANVIGQIDLSPFSKCPKFETLEIPMNRLKHIDLKPLAKCPNFKWLALDSNQLQHIDLSPLANCPKLEGLYLDENQLKNIDLSPLTNCPNLNDVTLNKNQYEFIDLTPLASCPDLERVVIDDVKHKIPKGDNNWLNVY